jgi:hypothetical protein
MLLSEPCCLGLAATVDADQNQPRRAGDSRSGLVRFFTHDDGLLESKRTRLRVPRVHGLRLSPLRPAELAARGGQVERIYVHAPDRLARRYAHQVLLVDEFHRAGAEVVFLNRPIGGTAEDDVLLQVQGVIAEYERAKILERGRRGRRHAAQSGSVSALTGAPFGYRYVSRTGAFRGGRRGSANRTTCLCLDRVGSGEPTRGLPTPAPGRISDPTAVRLHHPWDA